jgi:hypothetical protein
MMTTQEIIQADAEQRGADGAKAIRTMAALVKLKDGIMFRKNNSVLFLRKLDANDVELHLFTQDEPVTLARSLVYFVQQIRNSDLRAVYGRADNTQIIDLLRRLGVEVQASDRANYNWMALI